MRSLLSLVLIFDALSPHMVRVHMTYAIKYQLVKEL